MSGLWQFIESLYTRQLNSSRSKYFKYIAIAFGSVALGQIFWKLYFKIRRYPNGPIGLPLFGCAIQFGSNPFQFLSTLPIKYSPITYVPLMTSNHYFISDPKLLRQLYANQKIYALPRVRVRDTISFPQEQDLKIWAEKRKSIMKTVMTLTNSSFILEKINESLQNYIEPIIDEQYVKTQKLWHNAQHIKFILFHNIWCCMFDKRLPFNDPFIAQYIKASNEWLKTTSMSGIFDIFFNIFGLNEYLKEIFCYPYATTQNEILLKWMNNNGFQIDVSRNILKRSDDHKSNVYIDIMIEQLKQNQVEVANIVSDIQTVVAAALDTTSKTAEYGLILLAKYPNVQEIVYKELRDVMQKHNLKQFDFKILHELHTYKAFIYEVMRISCVVPLGVPHVVKHDNCKLQMNGKIINIPKYSMLQSNTYYMHRFLDWNNGKPLKYDNKALHLEYWLDSENKFTMNDNFVLFGLGKRNCPGQALAIRQMYAIFGLLMIKYKFIAPNDDQQSIDIQQTFNVPSEIYPPIEIKMKHR